jgi:hypothetical protein
MAADKNELDALSLVNQIKQCHDECLKQMDSTVGWAIKCGELLCQFKEHAGHGNFVGMIEQYFDFSYQTANVYMNLHKDLGKLSNIQRARYLKEANSIRGVQKLLAGPKQPRRQKPSTQAADSHVPPPNHATQIDNADPLDTPEPPPAPCCPNCGASDYDADEDGLYCRRCKEPAPEPPAEVIDTGKSKADTVQCPTCGGSGRIPKQDNGAGFDAFWRAITESNLPQTARLRRSRGQAEKAYKAAVKRLAGEGYSDPDGLLASRVRLYCASGEANKEQAKFCPLASTWLNAERYLEEPDQWACDGKNLNAGM